ncbi:MAG: bacillithiol biosynthesis BshC [Bacteroidia bacterium]|nr:bacillithiol biosynthesis cysteine-adding enzyme BshC [Bacteroidia bacterium]MDW8015313.1 bacillithiol biosynthesis BshC [Bacteroidia bacterium]
MPNRWVRYIAGDPDLAALLPWNWRDPPWEIVIQLRSHFPTEREALVEVLLLQNADFLQSDPLLHENIKSLAHPTTFTVTTGQQPGWLTGAFYTLIKAVHAVQLARQLNLLFQGRYRFVPVFWIAGEDHDAKEVCQIALGWDKVLQYEGVFHGAVGRHCIQEAFPEEAQNLALQRYWMPGKRWEVAFRESMQALFSGTGLVWLSPDDPVLKALALPLWVREIQEKVVYHAHRLAVSVLERMREKPRLSPRPINLFWLDSAERRYPDSTEERSLLKAAYERPERLSPNVLMRPLYQEYILPNVAYVAGPNEGAYWMELLPVFTAFEIPMPVVYPRGHVRVLPSEMPPLPSPLTPFHLWQLSQGRLRSLLAELWGEPILREVMGWWQTHRPSVEGLKEKPFLQSAVKNFHRFWNQWGKTLRHAALKQAYLIYREPIERVLRYREAVEPEGQLQERTLNIHAFDPMYPEVWFQRFLREVELQPGEWVHYFSNRESSTCENMTEAP